MLQTKVHCYFIIEVSFILRAHDVYQVSSRSEIGGNCSKVQMLLPEIADQCSFFVFKIKEVGGVKLFVCEHVILFCFYFA